MFNLSEYGRWMFYLAVIALILVYYVGATKEAPAFASAFVQMWYAISGRNAQGNYPNYPK